MFNALRWFQYNGEVFQSLMFYFDSDTMVMFFNVKSFTLIPIPWLSFSMLNIRINVKLLKLKNFTINQNQSKALNIEKCPSPWYQAFNLEKLHHGIRINVKLLKLKNFTINQNQSKAFNIENITMVLHWFWYHGEVFQG